MTKAQPLCLIIMPYDKKRDATGRVVDFDAVYQRLIVPAVQAAGMQPIRGEEGRTGSIIHEPLLERLILCRFAVVDLTTADANVFYKLGVRHALKPGSTVLLYAEGREQLPFDVHQFGAIPYRVSPQGLPLQEALSRALLTERLNGGSAAAADNPVHLWAQNIHKSADSRLEGIRDELKHASDLKLRLAQARLEGIHAVRVIADELGNLAEVASGVVEEIFFSYRDLKGWNEMIDLVPRMPAVLAATVLVQEQLGHALNRVGRGEEAEQVLRDLIAKRGPSSETYGVLGRILKYRWEMALTQGEPEEAKELLNKAAMSYLKGFEADWRDTYPGVNVVTLMELKEPADPRRREILPIVHYAVEQRIRSGAADYWDYATLLELAVLAFDEAKGVDALGRCVARVRASWEPEITARDLQLIREARQRRGAECPAWADRAEAELLKAAARGTARP